jgi:hypothetical protein
MLGGEESEDNNLLCAPIIKSRHDSDPTSKHSSTQQDSDYQEKAKPSSVFNPDYLVGRTFITDQKYGKPLFARLVKLIKEHHRNIYKNQVGTQLLFYIYDYQAEVINYNKFLEYWSKDKDNPIVRKFQHIVSCKGPLKPIQTGLTKLLRLPRQDHLDYIKSLSGYYLNNSDVPGSEGHWPKTIHGKLEELMPDDDPESLGSLVTPPQYFDLNLKHRGQVLSETNETAAYGSVFVASWNCFKQIIDLPNMPRYLGDPIRDKSHMFWDDRPLVDSSMQLNAKLHN